MRRYLRPVIRIHRQRAAGRPEGCVVAHLGNGASMCARWWAQRRQPMGFTAVDGLPMGALAATSTLA
jgi:acetate kinase